jgi:hypothetical protein
MAAAFSVAGAARGVSERAAAQGNVDALIEQLATGVYPAVHQKKSDS